MHKLDPTFKKARIATEARRRRRLWRRIGLLSGVVLLLGGGLIALLGSGLVWFGARPQPGVLPEPEEDAAIPVYIPAIVDLAGDPMKISLGDDFGAAQATRYVPRPDTLPQARATEQIALLQDVMVTSSQRFMTTLPSSPNDFAFYQSQRYQPAPQAAPSPPDNLASAAPDAVAPAADDYDADGWEGTAEEPVQIARPAVENTTSVAVARREADRFQPDEDYIARVLVTRSLDDMLSQRPYAEEDIAAYAAAMSSLLGKTTLDPADTIAVRGLRESRDARRLRIVQFSVYNKDGYIGSLARAADGSVAIGADPWVFDQLFTRTGNEDVAQPGRQYRLLDAIYSTGARNRVPTGVLGEAIMLLSRTVDLNAFASADDRLLLAYARDGAGEAGVGRVLYVGVRGPDRNIDCYVYKAAGDKDYSCFTENSRGQSVSVPGGMTNPVNGVLTSTFGPRMHPIFKEVRVHTGVDWAAPVGTPVFAAFAGTVKSAGDGAGYGNLIQISHPGGRETRYAHLQKFATGIIAGKPVAAGELIGYVGTTGNSTGPHLHFELRIAGAPSDPLQQTTVLIADDAAVETLTERIVHVESGGVADAKNPLSTATGAGQFIRATWLRMMATYRPDLARSMSETELLALRNDPTLAREMVKNLAREGEAYLKSRGHQITAGRLYLCHFLGMEDANRVLSTPPDVMLADVLAPGVLSANPFLVGRDVAYVTDWAERKMSGARPSRPAPAPVQVASPDFRLYKAAIDALLAPPEESYPGDVAALY